MSRSNINQSGGQRKTLKHLYVTHTDKKIFRFLVLLHINGKMLTKEKEVYITG